MQGLRSWRSYPARVGIQEPPPYPVLSNLLHLPASVQEDAKHPLPQINNARVFFRFRRLGGVVGHGVLFGYGRYYEGGMEVDQRGAERAKLGIPPANLEILYPVQFLMTSTTLSDRTPVRMV